MTKSERRFTPFVGPRPFEIDHSDIFFGRDSEINNIISLIISHRVLVIYAQSGAGKTSLLNAGVIPALINEEFDILPITRVRGMIPEEIDPDDVHNPYALNAILSWTEKDDEERNLHELNRLSINDFLISLKRNKDEDGFIMPRVIIFDQFEELFTAYHNRWHDRKKFILQVVEAIEHDPLLRVIFAIREDYFAQLSPFESFFPEKLRNKFRLESLKKDAGLEAIKGPLKKTTVTISEKAANEIIHDLLRVKVETSAGNIETITGQYIEPVQLQVVCENLWRELPETVTKITSDHLKLFGNVDQALIMFYENAISKAIKKTDVKEGDLRIWFEQKLITPARTRGTVFRGVKKTGGIINQAVDILEDEHVIRAERRKGGRWYELTHDRFIKPILDANEKWLTERKEIEQAVRRLDARAKEWVRLGKSTGGLYDEIELHDARQWIKKIEKAEISYSGDIKSLIVASEKNIKKEKAEKEKEYRRELEQVKALAEAEKKSAEANAKMNRWLRYLIRSLVAIILILSVGIIGYFYFYHWEYSAYYNTVTKKFGIPVGVGKLSKEQVRHRKVSLRLTKKGRAKSNHVFRMEAVNNKFELTTDHSIGTYFEEGDSYEPKECLWEFNCDENGSTIYEIAYDKNRRIVWGLSYGPEHKGNRLERNAYFMNFKIGSREASDGSPSKIQASSGSNISESNIDTKTQKINEYPAGSNFEFSNKSIKIVYDNNGNEIRLFYRDINGKPVTGPFKAYGRKQEYYKNGLTKRIISIDTKGKPLIDEAGNAILDLSYDKYGNVVREVAKDTRGQITILKDGWAIAEYEYEPRYGNMIYIRYFDEESKPVLNNDGYSSCSLNYDNRGNVIRLEYYDTSGNPVEPGGEYNYAGWRAAYDDNGKMIKRLFLDVKGNPVEIKKGYNYAGWKASYDNDGNVIEKSYFDINENPVNYRDENYASWKAEYDKNGEKIFEAIFDVNGDPVNYSGTNYASWRSEYDSYGNKIKDAIFDKNGNPVNYNGLNFASWERKFDSKGHKIYAAIFDTNGDPVNFKGKNYASWEARFDKNGNQIYGAIFDVKGKPVNYSGTNYASWRSEYDSYGNKIKDAIFDKNGKPVNFEGNNYASWRSEYDSYGNKIKDAIFDKNGNPVNYKGLNFASWKMKFDSKGHKIYAAIFDTNGDPVNFKGKNYASWEAKYDKNGILLRVDYFDIHGNRIEKNN